MNRAKLEVADIFNQFGHHLNGLLPEQWKTVQAIKNCRTEVLGGHRLRCQTCKYEKNAYNSCRNRHCPKCQFLAKVRWVENRKEDLLPCPYFHVVFTIPAELRAVFLRNKKTCYSILFKASSEALKEVADRNLKIDIGFIGILHTWGQNLIDHPHVHYVVPGGGLHKKKKKWISYSEDYFLNVKALSKVFKAKVLQYLEEAFHAEKLKFIGEVEYLSSHFDHFLFEMNTKSWVVYCKKPFSGPNAVIDYLGQYTHRIGISNQRLVKIEEEIVSFKVRDRNNPEKKKIMKLHVKEFMRRFLLHVLPRGFVRMRHFGFLGNRSKREKISLIRKLKGILKKPILESIQRADWREILKRVAKVDVRKCPKCKTGELLIFGQIMGLLNSS